MEDKAYGENILFHLKRSGVGTGIAASFSGSLYYSLAYLSPSVYYYYYRHYHHRHHLLFLFLDPS